MTSFRTRLLVKETLVNLCRAHEQIKLVKEKRIKETVVVCSFTISFTIKLDELIRLYLRQLCLYNNTYLRFDARMHISPPSRPFSAMFDTQMWILFSPNVSFALASAPLLNLRRSREIELWRSFSFLQPKIYVEQELELKIMFQPKIITFILYHFSGSVYYNITQLLENLLDIQKFTDTDMYIYDLCSTIWIM